MMAKIRPKPAPNKYQAPAVFKNTIIPPLELWPSLVTRPHPLKNPVESLKWPMPRGA